MQRPLLLRFSERTKQGPYFNLVTVEWARNRLPGCHTHNYPEIFWITRGECEHVLNGTEERLETGTLFLLRPSDVHQLRPWHGRGGFALTNLALAPAAFVRLSQSYPEEVRILYPKDGYPTRRVLARAELDGLNEEARDLASSGHSLFHLDRIVLGIWNRALQRATFAPATADLPDWLQNALIQMQEPEIFSRGVSGFVAVAGRCHEHVNRVCRRHLGKTPSQIINEARLRYVAHALRMTSRSVSEIALDCGFENPAQLHRLFRAAYQTTPGRYRRE
ncbi:MAG: helix-turn-helix domain-containing protein [Opitutaceae bacterium]|jgi:AraC family cel operon transcriptional repressor